MIVLMKLFLTSQAISAAQVPEFIKLVGKNNPIDIRIALIENAADPYPPDSDWLLENRKNIMSYGFEVDIVDLKKYCNGEKGLLARLKKADVIWLGGGNTYFFTLDIKTNQSRQNDSSTS